MQVWNVHCAARWKCRTQKIAIRAPSHNFVWLYLRNWGTYRQSETNLLSTNISSTCPHSMVNFGPLAAEIVSLVWGTPANINGFGVLAALLHGTVVVGVSQILRRWTEGATYIRQGGHHVGNWPTFLVKDVVYQVDIDRVWVTECLSGTGSPGSSAKWLRLHLSDSLWLPCVADADIIFYGRHL